MHDNVLTIDLGAENAGALVELHNLALTRVVEKVDGTPGDLTDQDTSVFDGPNANPKVITLDENGSAVIVAVGRSSGLRDGRAGTDANGHLAAMPGGGDDFIYEVKSFHDNRIQIKHLRHNVGGLPHTEYVTIDNVRPVLAVYGPAQPLYVRRGVNVTFIFEFLDVDSGFTDEFEEVASSELVDTLSSTTRTTTVSNSSWRATWWACRRAKSPRRITDGGSSAASAPQLSRRWRRMCLGTWW